MKRRDYGNLKEILVLIILGAALLGFVIFSAVRYPDFLGGIFYTEENPISTVSEEDGQPSASFTPAFPNGSEGEQVIPTVTEIVPPLTTAVQPTAPESTDKGLKVTFIDVGQGDAILLTCEGMNMIIDGGEASQAPAVYEKLVQNGVTHMHFMVATHPESDHTGGLTAAFQGMSTEHLYTPVTAYDNPDFNTLLTLANQNGTQIHVPQVGETIYLGSARVEFLGPSVADSSNINNNSLIVKVTYGNNSFLFMGDAEAAEEANLINSGFDLKTDVLKVAHHGASDSTSDAFLNAAAPGAAIVSYGRNNTYGHPSQDVLVRLNTHGAVLYTTENSGSITAFSDGSSISWNFER